MKRGCPQGSSSGPLLWNMFQNDLPLHVENGNITMYADDHQLHVKGTNHEIVRQQLKTLSRAIYRSHPDTYEELLERANLPTLYNRLQDIVVPMYEVK